MLKKPEPFHLADAATLNVIPLPFPGGELGWPGPPAGDAATGLTCTVPSGATFRMSSFDLSELKVIEWAPMTHQVTEPPTGILIVLGPNSSIEPGPFGETGAGEHVVRRPGA